MKRHRALKLVLLLCLVSLLNGCSGGETESKLLVFAAASTTLPVTEIGELFTQTTGIPVENSFASSSVLRRKIEQARGQAGIDVYFSASLLHMDALKHGGGVKRETIRIMLGNSLVLIVPAGAEQVPGSMAEAVEMGRTPIAMGDPDAKVPCGMYARQALETMGLWDKLEVETSRESTVRAALARVEETICPAGIVYRSDAALNDRVKVAFTVPEDSHEPIRYAAAAVTGADHEQEAGKYLEFLQSPAASNVFKKYGFQPLDE